MGDVTRGKIDVMPRLFTSLHVSKRHLLIVSEYVVRIEGIRRVHLLENEQNRIFLRHNQFMST